MLIRSLSKTAVVALATIAIGAATATDARASVFSVTPNPIPQGTGFDLNTPSGICITPTECTHDVYINNFQLQNETSLGTSVGYDEQFTANLSASFVNPSNGSAPSGSATLALVSGTYFDLHVLSGFSPFNNAIGSFSETLIAASFAGSDTNGNAITFALAATPSTGSVTIASTTGGFTITNGFTVNAASTSNGSPITVPPLTASNIAASVPEPATITLLAVSMFGTAFARRRRNVRA